MRQNNNHRRILLSLILLTIVVFSGSMSVLGADNSDSDVKVSINAKVSADEVVGSYEVTYIVRNGIYNNELKSAADRVGNSSSKEYLGFFTNKSLRQNHVVPEITNNTGLDVENFKITKESNNGKTVVTVRYERYKPAKNTSIELKKLGDNGTIHFEDTGMLSSLGGGNYTLTMPGEIRNSTADWIDGDTATWNWNNSSDYYYMQAKSDTSGGLPGLGVLGDLVPLILGIGLVVVIGLVLFIWTK